MRVGLPEWLVHPVVFEADTDKQLTSEAFGRRMADTDPLKHLMQLRGVGVPLQPNDPTYKDSDK